MSRAESVFSTACIALWCLAPMVATFAALVLS